MRQLLTPESRRSAATRRPEASRDALETPVPGRLGTPRDAVPGRHFAQVSLVLVFYLCFSVLAWSACCWSALGLSFPLFWPGPPLALFRRHTHLHSSSLLHSRPAHPLPPFLPSPSFAATRISSPLLILSSPLPSCSPPSTFLPLTLFLASTSHPTACLVLLHPPLPLLTSHSRRPDCAPAGDALPGGQGRRARPCQRPGPRGRTRGPTGASWDECRSVGGEDLACWSPQARAHRSHPRRADRPARARPARFAAPHRAAANCAGSPTLFPTAAYGGPSSRSTRATRPGASTRRSPAGSARTASAATAPSAPRPPSRPRSLPPTPISSPCPRPRRRPQPRRWQRRDMAIVSVMSDAGLRRSAAAVVTWADVAREDDGRADGCGATWRS